MLGKGSVFSDTRYLKDSLKAFAIMEDGRMVKGNGGTRVEHLLIMLRNWSAILFKRRE